MNYVIHKDDANIITVVYKGEVDLHHRKMAVNQVCNMVVKSEAVKLLIDIREIINIMSIDEQTSFGEYLASRAELKNAKVATVRGSESYSNGYIDAIAYYEGYQVVDFCNKEEAILWLSSLIR